MILVVSSSSSLSQAQNLVVLSLQTSLSLRLEIEESLNLVYSPVVSIRIEGIVCPLSFKKTLTSRSGLLLTKILRSVAQADFTFT
jgi:hypothetical protein